jgi:putative transposase
MKATAELGFLNEVSSVPLQQAVRHQQAAFSGFFARRVHYPRYKSRADRQSAEYTRSGFRYRDGRLFLAKMSVPLRFTWSWPDIDPASVDPTTVTVSRDPDGRWYVSFAADAEAPEPLPARGSVVGVDLGVKDFPVTSDGQRTANPGHLERRARNPARYQRRLARAISDCGWGEFRRQLEYKCERYGRTLIVADRWYPSSKTCSVCGHLLASLSVSTRHRTCPSCGTRHDRDHNAAKNILAAGLAVARIRPGDACAAGVRHSGSPRVQPAVKQEPGPARTGIPGHLGGE